jgi:hypothetical protein
VEGFVSLRSKKLGRGWLQNMLMDINMRGSAMASRNSLAVVMIADLCGRGKGSALIRVARGEKTCTIRAGSKKTVTVGGYVIFYISRAGLF